MFFKKSALQDYLKMILFLAHESVIRAGEIEAFVRIHAKVRGWPKV